VATVRVSGLTEVTAALKRLETELQDMPETMDEIAREGARLASSFAPKRSGRLAASHRPSIGPGKASVTSTLVYAGVINYGWRARNVRPARYLQRVDTQLAARAVQLLDQGADRAIRKVGLS
jgi:phage gpG-like protein